MFAIIHISGHQYKVFPGDTIVVDRLNAQVDASMKISDVLLYSDGDSVLVGKPYLDSVVVTAKVIAQGKGQKLRVARFKAKSRYRRVTGFRPSQTTLSIESIKSISGKAAQKKKETVTKKSTAKKPQTTRKLSASAA